MNKFCLCGKIILKIGGINVKKKLILLSLILCLMFIFASCGGDKRMTLDRQTDVYIKKNYIKSSNGLYYKKIR